RRKRAEVRRHSRRATLAPPRPASAQLEQERDLRSGRVHRPEETEQKAVEAVAVAAAAHEALPERRQRRASNVLVPRDHSLGGAIGPLELEVAPVLLDQVAVSPCPVVRDRVVTGVLDHLAAKARKRSRARVHRRTELRRTAARERALAIDPAPKRAVERLVAKVELPRTVDDGNIGGERRHGT